MAYTFNDGLDDPLSFERIEVVRGMDGFTPPGLLGPELAQSLQNTIISDNLRPKTRPGADALSGAVFAAGKVQGLGWFSVPSNQKVIAAVNGSMWSWDGSAKAAVTGFTPASAASPVEMVQGMNRLFAVDGASDLHYFDGSSFVALAYGGVSGESGNAPAGASLVLWHTSRLFLAGVASDPETIWASDIYDVAAGKWDHVNFSFEAGDGEGDPIVGLASLTGSNLAVLKESAIMIFDTDPLAANASAWARVFDSKGVGCVGRRAFAVVGNDLHFMSTEGVMSLGRMASSGENWELLPPISRPVQPLINRINWAFGSRICARKYKHLVLWGVPLDSAEEPNYTLVYNTRTESWNGFWTGWTPTVFGVSRFNGVQRLLIGDTTGRVNQWKDFASEDLEGTFQDNGAEIETRWMLRGMMFGEPGSKKDMEAYLCRFEESQGLVNVDVYLDGTLARSDSYDLTDDQNGLPVDLPFDLATDKPKTRGDFVIGLEEFSEGWFEVWAESGKMQLRNFQAAAFVKSVEMP